MERESGLVGDAAGTGGRTETVSERVISAVSEATGTDPLELDPLYDVVDPDALNAIFAGDASSDTELRFTMAGCEVVVRGEGNVVVTPPADRPADDLTARRRTE